MDSPSQHSKYTVLTPPHGPWPWYDIGTEEEESDDVCCSGGQSVDWRCYPHALFCHWPEDQLKKTGLKEDVENAAKAVGKAVENNLDGDEIAFALRSVDVTMTGEVSELDTRKVPLVTEGYSLDQFWDKRVEKERKSNLRVRVLSVEKLSWRGMQMLGSKYRIGPFFFLASLHRSPSQYHKKIEDATGREVMSIILPFLRTKPYPVEGDPKHVRLDDPNGCLTTSFDLLAVYMTHGTGHDNTIITYHPSHNWRSIYDDNIEGRIRDCTKGGAYREVMKNQNHPVFVLLLFFWHAIYAWDEALDRLYPYISDLEEKIMHDTDMESMRRDARNLRKSTQILHYIQAELLSYHPQLVELLSSVEFVFDTYISTMEKDSSEGKVLLRECEKLKREIQRLDDSRKTPTERLGNVIDLVLNHSNITMTEATLTDSSSTMQLSFLALIFLPGSFVAGIFSINMVEIDPQTSLMRFLEVTIPLTVIAVCLGLRRDYSRGGVVARIFQSFPKTLGTFRRKPSENNQHPSQRKHEASPSLQSVDVLEFDSFDGQSQYKMSKMEMY